MATRLSLIKTTLGINSSRVLGDSNGNGLNTRGSEAVVGDIKAQQGTVGEKHRGNGLTPRSSQAVAREK